MEVARLDSEQLDRAYEMGSTRPDRIPLVRHADNETELPRPYVGSEHVLGVL